MPYLHLIYGSYSFLNQLQESALHLRKHLVQLQECRAEGGIGGKQRGIKGKTL